MADPVVVRFDLVTPAAQAAAWRVLSDTDRFNRVAGFGFAWGERQDGDRTVRTGKVRRFGMDLAWDESPWEFRAPEWFRLVRRFHGGPAEKLETELRLTPRPGGGTAVAYEVRVYPRNFLAKPVVALDATVSTRPQIAAALDKALAHLAGDAGYDAPPPLDDAIRKRVEAACREIAPKGVGAGLRDVLLFAPLSEQDQLRPLALATRWGVTGEEAVTGCLAAVRAGLLVLQFDLMCPSCNGGKARLDTLGRPGEVHCPSCEIAFDGAFPDSVEAVFRTAPAVRVIAPRTDCASSPARTPHIVAQAYVGPGAEKSEVWALERGAYRFAVKNVGTSIVEVIDGADREASLVIEADTVVPGVLRVAPGATLHVRNRRKDGALVSLRAQWRPDGALTAGRLLQIPGVAALLPAGALAQGLEVEAGRRAVLVVESMDALDDVRKRFRDAPMREHAGNGILVTTWDTAEHALAGAEGLAGDPRLRAAVAVGAVVEVGGVPSGEAVDAALAALRRAGNGRVRLAPACAGEPDLVAAIERLAGRVVMTAAGSEIELRFPDAERRRQRAPIDRRKTSDGKEAFAGLYRLVTLLGEGGFGQVWEAEELGEGGRRLALKLLKDELAADAVATQRFYNEARIVSKLSSPHTVRVFDYGTGGAKMYMAMERLSGRELAHEIAVGPLPPERVVRIGKGILAALADAHAHGVVHRDLKPENVFVLDDDVAKVIDFGIAHHPEGTVGEKTGFVLGTPLYMAPEQIEGHIDARSDLYSVGLVLYQALTGKLPWEGPPKLVVFARLDEDPTPLATHRPDVPPALAAVIMRALARDPDARWPSAQAMEAALGA